jgi:hypothetical protein
MKKNVSLLMFVLAFLAGCSSNKPTSSAPAESAPKQEMQQVTGREAFQRLYVTARSWSPDAQAYFLESGTTTEARGRDGKAAVWRAGFASPSRRMQERFQWSGLTGPDAPERGVSHGTEDTYSASNSSTQVFEMARIQIDSDAAFNVAQKHGGDKLLKWKADTPVTYRLQWDPRKSELYWRVAYGRSSDNPDLAVDVNASQPGEFLRVEK